MNRSQRKKLVEAIVAALEPHKNRILTTAAVGLAGSQFEALRKTILDELGRSGFENSLGELIGTDASQNAPGQDWKGPDHTAKKGGGS